MHGPARAYTASVVRALACILACAAAAAVRASGPEPAAPPRVALAPWAEGFERPVGLAFGPRHAWLVEQGGRLWRLAHDGTGRALVLDLSERVSRGFEQGLLGVALHPRFAENGRMFLYYTDREGAVVLAEARVAGGTVRGRLRRWLRLPQPAANHNGGQLAFGPDGHLWLGPGDGGGAGDPWGNAQDPRSPLGKLLRLDVDRPGARPEVWALGLRNPWRFSFDRATGELWIADVGQDRREEIDRAPAGHPKGLNYGWNLKEGSLCFADPDCARRRDLVDPVFEYGHDEGCSVTGGFVYRGRAIPALRGVYVFSDWCTGPLWGLKRGADGRWRRLVLMRRTGTHPSSFAEDGAGELYLLDHRGGRVLRIVPAAPSGETPGPSQNPARTP